MYKIIVDKENLRSSLCCTGEQLIVILKQIKKTNISLTWYGIDIEYAGKVGINALFPESIDGKVFRLGNTWEFIEKVKSVIQFDRGVFIAFSDGVIPEWDYSVLPETEELDEGIQNESGIIEIRAFDYTCFDIFAKDSAVLDSINSVLPRMAAIKEIG